MGNCCEIEQINVTVETHSCWEMKTCWEFFYQRQKRRLASTNAWWLHITYHPNKAFYFSSSYLVFPKSYLPSICSACSVLFFSCFSTEAILCSNKNHVWSHAVTLQDNWTGWDLQRDPDLLLLTTSWACPILGQYFWCRTAVSVPG